MTLKYFTTAVAPFYELPIRSSSKRMDIPQGMVVEVEKDFPSFLGVNYAGVSGWIGETLAEPYVENFPTNCVQIDNQTPDLTDFEQYFLFRGLKQVNACGELCICLALSLTLSDFMSMWEIKSPSLRFMMPDEVYPGNPLLNWPGMATRSTKLERIAR